MPGRKKLIFRMDFVFYDSNSNLNEVLEQLSSLNAGADVWLLHQNIREQADVWASYPVGNADILFQNKGILTSDFLNIPTHLVVNWLFLSPEPGITSNAWRSEGYVCFFKKGVIAKNGGVDNEYSTLAYSISDFHYRALMNGACVRCLPLAEIETINDILPRAADEFRFALKVFGRKKTAFIRYLLFRQFGFKALITAPDLQRFKVDQTSPFATSWKDHVSSFPPYSAIIPTIDRYPYLARSIESLLTNAYPPDEIIVVDQTPKERRNVEFYHQWDNALVKVTFLDQAGQCSSRNLAIKQARNEILLLFEDDAEAWPEMIAAHLRLLLSNDVSASTGISLAPWKDRSHIAAENRHIRISDVLATGNCMIKKSAIEEVGGLNPAFEKGSGADDDLGRRLFLKGHSILFNPEAIELHHKAPSGGMRVHGSWWRNKSAWNKEFPPATQVYNIYRYYGSSYLRFYLFTSFLKAMRTYTLKEKLIMMILLPYKLFLSIKRGKKLYAANTI